MATEPHGLVLTLPEGGHLTIGDDIDVWVFKRGPEIGVIINAPSHLRILRPDKHTPTTTH